jgi:hypothetical protein
MTVVFRGNCGAFMWDFAVVSAVLRTGHARYAMLLPRLSFLSASMHRLIPVLIVLATLMPLPALAQQALTERAISAALDTFEAAWPGLGRSEMGVDSAAYRDALSLHRFSSAHWGGTVTVDVVAQGEASGNCARFAAYTRMPPENGSIRLVLCPRFFSEGADALRELTVLHEMVHVVAGGDECRAMAYAARIQQLAHGAFTPVDAYWTANGCEGSGFALPE